LARYPFLSRIHVGAAFHPKCLEIFYGKFDNEHAFVTAPSIAFDAAGKALAITVNLDKPFSATAASSESF
jgi:hypothetical protein